MIAVPFREVVGAKLRLHLHPGQTRVWDSTARIVAMLAGSQGGKTVFGPHWLHREIERCGEGDYLVGTATFPLLNLKLLPEYRLVFCELLKWGTYAERQGTHAITSNDGKSRIIFFSATNSESIESATAKAAHLDECLAPETLIATEIGNISIAEIVSKQLRLKVWSYDTIHSRWQLKPIVRWIRLHQREMLMSLGRLNLTARHKVWTDIGYMSVAQILSAYYNGVKAEGVYDATLRELPESFDQTRPKKILQYQVCCGGQRAAPRISPEAIGAFQTILPRPDPSRRDIAKTERTICRCIEATLGSEGWRDHTAHIEGEGTCVEEHPADSAVEVRGQRAPTQLASGKASERTRVEKRVCCHNWRRMDTTRLQNRCCGTDPQDSDRSWERWKPRQEGVVQAEWLDISAFLEQDGRSLAGRVSSDGCVYNLEVEDNHNYVANGILLSNCGQKQFRQDTWDAVNRRLAIHRGRMLLTTTLYTLGWLKTEVFDRWQAGDKGIDVIQFDSIENPAYPVEEFERARASLPPWKFAMFNRGRFETPAGLVYDSLRPDCVVARMPIPKDWPVYVGHDFGSANPAALFVAVSPVGEYWVFAEYLPGPGRGAHEHVEEWKKITAGHNVMARIGGNQTTEQDSRDLYATHGWPIAVPLQKLVSEQILRVITQHRLNKIKVFRDLRHYLAEKASFSYELDDKYQPTDKYEDEHSYHLIAAERYLHTYFTPETAAVFSGREEGLLTYVG